MQQPIVGILLAGGKSSRFGSPKMFAEHNGKAFYHHSLDAITPFVKLVYMVTQPHYVDQIKSAEADVSIMIDLPSVREKGPLAGMYSVMQENRSTWYLVIPTDVPFMTEATIHLIVKEIQPGYQAIIPSCKGRLQPLVGVYHATVAPLIEEMLQAGDYAVYQLLQKLKVKTVEVEDEEPFYNLNYQRDYDYLIKK